MRIMKVCSAYNLGFFFSNICRVCRAISRLSTSNGPKLSMLFHPLSNAVQCVASVVVDAYADKTRLSTTAEVLSGCSSVCVLVACSSHS